jgi:hypothetical protein
MFGKSSGQIDHLKSAANETVPLAVPCLALPPKDGDAGE